MFAEVKAMMPNRVSGKSYDEQIAMWTKAAVADLTGDQIVLDGICDISYTKNEETGIVTVTDNSTIEDELVFAACAIYCSMNIGNPPNYDNLRAAYNAHKGHMRTSSKYKGAEG